MTNPKLKLWLNQLLNQVVQETRDPNDQVELMRELGDQLRTEAAALELVSMAKVGRL